MELINELIIPFNKKEEIDYEILNDLINQSIKNHNRFLLLSLFGEGEQLSIEEKISIIKFINLKDCSNKSIFFQSKDNHTNKILINELNKTNIKDVFLSPPLDISYSQNGLFLFIKNIIKKLDNKNIILVNSPLNKHMTFNFQTIRKLLKLFPNIKGIYEDSIDYSLINLIKKYFPNIDIYLNENNLKKALELNVKGIISLSSIAFNNEYKELLNDYENGFINQINLSYLLFVNEILNFNNNSSLLKIYLKMKNYYSMEMRLPLYYDKDDESNLDFLLP